MDPVLVEVTRGGCVESAHRGAVIVVDATGGVVFAAGDVDQAVFPRSAVKALLALPMVESGAAARLGLSDAEIALACSSHSGEEDHVATATSMLAKAGRDVSVLECGTHWPSFDGAARALAAAGKLPSALHNNCSGKHSGFLTMNRHIKGHSEYVEHDHPLQVMVKSAFEETTGEESAGWGVDGCSAPNFATSIHGLAQAMGRFAGATGGGDRRERAMHRLTRAMAQFPELVAGDTGTDTELMRAMDGKVTIKGGAEAVHIAILPQIKRGIAIKIVDGGYRASDAVMTALLVRLGALDANHPYAKKRLNAVQTNWRGKETGIVTLAPGFL